MGYTEERAALVATLGITDDTDLSMDDLRKMIDANARDVTRTLGPNVAQPSIAASTVAVTNDKGVDCTVYIAGGTVTVVAIDGTATGLTGGTFQLNRNQTIAITYSVAPTWKWFGN